MEYNWVYRPADVQCSTVPSENKYNYVFTLPSEFMRHRATTFEHFRTTQKAKDMQLCFHFFLDFVAAMLSESKSKQESIPKGQRAAAFVEWCPSSFSKTELSTCGWRFHVFVDREVNEMRVLEFLLQKFARETEKLSSRNKPVPAHYQINTMAKYASKVCEVYTGEQGNVEQLWQGLSEGCQMAPSNIFELDVLENSVFSVAATLMRPRSLCFLRRIFAARHRIVVCENASQIFARSCYVFVCQTRNKVLRDPFNVDFLAHGYRRHCEHKQN